MNSQKMQNGMFPWMLSMGEIFGADVMNDEIFNMSTEIIYTSAETLDLRSKTTYGLFAYAIE